MRKVKISVGKWSAYITSEQLFAYINAAENGIDDLYVESDTGKESYEGGRLQLKRYKKASASLDEAYRLSRAD